MPSLNNITVHAQPLVEPPPSDWFHTVEVDTWLKDRKLPTNSVPAMLKYINLHFQQDNPFRIVDNQILPQSYAHWWCYSRPITGQERRPLRPIYPRLEHWKQIAEDHKGTNTVDDIFALIYNWLDILSLDLLVMDNENWREGVPRLVGSNIVLVNHTQLKSRKETVRYLIKEGASIFEERGWKQGLEYWNTDCKKYLF